MISLKEKGTKIIITKDKLKSMGLKLTPQRLAIIRFLEENRIHPSAEDIYKEIKVDYPSLSLATVYNTLDVLTEAGEIQEILINPDKRNFDYNPVPHSHFFCRVCLAVCDLEAGLMNAPVPREVSGYLVEGYALNFYGVCPVCQEKQYNHYGGNEL